MKQAGGERTKALSYAGSKFGLGLGFCALASRLLHQGRRLMSRNQKTTVHFCVFPNLMDILIYYEGCHLFVYMLVEISSLRTTMLLCARLPLASPMHRWLALDERLEYRTPGHRPKRCSELAVSFADRPVILSRETAVTHGKKERREHSVFLVECV